MNEDWLRTSGFKVTDGPGGHYHMVPKSWIEAVVRQVLAEDGRNAEFERGYAAAFPAAREMPSQEVCDAAMRDIPETVMEVLLEEDAEKRCVVLREHVARWERIEAAARPIYRRRYEEKIRLLRGEPSQFGEAVAEIDALCVALEAK